MDASTGDPALRTYIDTMVFVYHLGPSKSALSAKAERFFRDMEEGKYIGVATSFSVMEFIAVCKELLSKVRGPQGLSASDVARIRQEIETFIDDMGIVLYDADDLATRLGSSTIFSEAEPILEEATPISGSRDGKPRVIGGADALHVVMAIRANSELFVTFDEGFKGSKSWIQPLLLSEVY